MLQYLFKTQRMIRDQQEQQRITDVQQRHEQRMRDIDIAILKRKLSNELTDLDCPETMKDQCVITKVNKVLTLSNQFCGDVELSDTWSLEEENNALKIVKNI